MYAGWHVPGTARWAGRTGRKPPPTDTAPSKAPIYGFKLHAVCGLNGVIHSFDLTQASVHDLHFLKDVKAGYAHCTLLADKGYISAQVRLDLFESARIRLEVPCRKSQRDRKPAFQPFAKARKRMESVFSQLCDQSMIVCNHAKDTERLFTRIVGEITSMHKKTVCQTGNSPYRHTEKSSEIFFTSNSLL